LNQYHQEQVKTNRVEINVLSINAIVLLMPMRLILRA